MADAALTSPHGDLAKTAWDQTYQAVQGLADRLGPQLGTPFEEGYGERTVPAP